MAQRTIDRFYPTYAEAVQVVADLMAAGVPPADVSLIDGETDARLPQDVAADRVQNPLITGVTLGAAIGAGIGALAGVNAITIPYTEALVDTGWVLPCVLFAVIFGLFGAIIGAIAKLAVKDNAAQAIASRLQRGQQMVMVRADASELPMIQDIMARSHTIPTAALATSEPLYDVAIPTVATTVGDEVDPPIGTLERRTRFR